MVRLTWAQVNNWRVVRHHLARRAPREQLAQVVGDVCGIHAQLMSAAELSIWARVEGVTPDDVRKALWEQRVLVKTWCMRGTLHLLPASEYPIYLAALKTRQAYRSKAWLKFYRLTLEQIEGIISEVHNALDTRLLTRQQLAAEVGKKMGPRVKRELGSGWGSLLKPSAFQGNLIFGPSQGQNTVFVRPDQWVGKWDEVDSEEALKQLFRRYLRAYGPATHEDFPRWWGTLPGRARRILKSISDELKEVEAEGRRGWILATDASHIRSSQHHSVRLLPHFDCYLIGCYPRESLVAPRFQARVYRPQAWVSPVVLVDGVAAGVWEQRRNKNKVQVSVKPFVGLSPDVERKVREETARLGEFYGTSAELSLSN